ncbi:MAG TPA: response regulator, partial [Rhodothermales bacterium]|nr:response regulator [Rhodothermales bacterium]
FGDDALDTPGVYNAGAGSPLDAHFADEDADENGMDGAGSWLMGASTPEEIVVSPTAEPPPSAYVSFEEVTPVAPSGPPSLVPVVMEADVRPAILVVEDNDDTRALLEHILRSQYRVTAVGDARSALDHLNKNECDGLVLDINLGGKQTGADILRIARVLPGNEQIFAVALTAYALPGDRERFLQAGFDQYVSKPFTRSTLMAALREGVPGAV